MIPHYGNKSLIEARNLIVNPVMTLQKQNSPSNWRVEIKSEKLLNQITNQNFIRGFILKFYLNFLS